MKNYVKLLIKIKMELTPKGLRNILIGYTVFMLIVIIAFIATGAYILGHDTTIVVDASAYLQKELKAADGRISELDATYNTLFQDLAKSHRVIDSLKSRIYRRNTTIDSLKNKITDEPLDNDIIITDEQSDTIFTNFLNGLN